VVSSLPLAGLPKTAPLQGLPFAWKSDRCASSQHPHRPSGDRFAAEGERRAFSLQATPRCGAEIADEFETSGIRIPGDRRDQTQSSLVSIQMEAADDVDEDELALAMSTELIQPAPTVPMRRTRSFASLGTSAALVGEQSGFADTQPSLEQHSRGSPSATFPSKFIRIKDHSTEMPDKDDSDGLWASSVTVTDPSIVRGTGQQGIAAATGYVGLSPYSGTF
jgi:hypothetical protein